MSVDPVLFDGLFVQNLCEDKQFCHATFLYLLGLFTNLRIGASGLDPKAINHQCMRTPLVAPPLSGHCQLVHYALITVEPLDS